MRLFYLGIGRQAAPEAHQRDEEVAVSGAEIPVKEWRIRNNPVHTCLRTLFSSEGSNRQPTCAVARKSDVGVAVGANLTQGRVDVGKILLHVAYVERILPRFETAAVTPQINGIEIEAAVNEPLPHFALEEIVVEAVDIQIRFMASLRVQAPDYGRATRTVEGHSLVYIPGFIALKDILMPLSVERFGALGRFGGIQRRHCQHSPYKQQ